MISDNVPFDSWAIEQFAKSWVFGTRTVSQNHPKSNGQVEKPVGIAENISRKIRASDTDSNTALLEYRNSPISGTTWSPVELLMSRQLRHKVPIARSCLLPRVLDGIHKTFEAIQMRLKNYYDHNAQEKPEFKNNEKIYLQNPHNKLWGKSKIVEKTNKPRSYIVEAEEGKIYRRNSFAIRKK
ncbi:hypothetical protein JTB14_019410 [Gonioctena quinquepunctata]|nr:hypothetical protein JTB14_019410 [Gonioctena quinquepunctata]